MTPTRYVAFLRAINVGGHTVKMDRLRALFAAIGADDVSTVVASGNVRFASTDPADVLEARIEDALAGALGYEVTTFVRTDAEVRRLAGLDPFGAAATGPDDKHHIGFLKGPPGRAQRAAIAALSSDADLLALKGRELHWRRRGRFSDSVLTGATLEKALGAPVTLRNRTTVQKCVLSGGDASGGRRG